MAARNSGEPCMAVKPLQHDGPYAQATKASSPTPLTTGGGNFGGLADGTSYAKCETAVGQQPVRAMRAAPDAHPLDACTTKNISVAICVCNTASVSLRTQMRRASPASTSCGPKPLLNKAIIGGQRRHVNRHKVADGLRLLGATPRPHRKHEAGHGLCIVGLGSNCPPLHLGWSDNTRAPTPRVGALT